MGDRPALLSARRHKRWLPARGRHVEHKLDPEAPNSVDDRVYLRVVLTGLELDYARLRDAQLPRQGGRLSTKDKQDPTISFPSQGSECAEDADRPSTPKGQALVRHEFGC